MTYQDDYQRWYRAHLAAGKSRSESKRMAEIFARALESRRQEKAERARSLAATVPGVAVAVDLSTDHRV